jgi:tetratricopeptide (TPR) repeat protein
VDDVTPPSEYDNVCFVIMPFGEKQVGDQTVDFDAIYRSVFEPAIGDVTLPEGGPLLARRADSDFFSGHIDLEMFHYLEYSRISLADITGLNPNVFYELGARHRARESGTIVLRQRGAPIPFDIKKIKAFGYDPEPAEAAAESRRLITDVLGRSLEHNRLDSPVQIALREQRDRRPPEVDEILRSAEDALRGRDTAAAIARYGDAVRANPADPALRMTVGLLHKDRGEWGKALEQFRAATELSSSYAEAYRERGIAENKLSDGTEGAGDLPGEGSLRRAIELNPEDFDALASLGGALKRAGRLPEALELYRRATDASQGHTYPLLNEITLEAHLEGALPLRGRVAFLLARAERALRAQVEQDPPYNAPWSAFDMAETCLYRGDEEGFKRYLDLALLHVQHAWQARTFGDTLALLGESGVELPGLAEGRTLLEEAIGYLPE